MSPYIIMELPIFSAFEYENKESRESNNRTKR